MLGVVPSILYQSPLLPTHQVYTHFMGTTAFNALCLHQGLLLDGATYYKVKEGEDLDVVCTPSPETVGLEWELPQTVVSNGATTVVQYREPLRHTLTIRTANINHNGSYTCSVVGDEQGVVSPITANVRVLESKSVHFKLFFRF